MHYHRIIILDSGHITASHTGSGGAVYTYSHWYSIAEWLQITQRIFYTRIYLAGVEETFLQQIILSSRSARIMLLLETLSKSQLNSFHFFSLDNYVRKGLGTLKKTIIQGAQKSKMLQCTKFLTQLINLMTDITQRAINTYYLLITQLPISWSRNKNYFLLGLPVVGFLRI